ncbi:hypothetical protein NPIL_663951 [Nephila pilipes]|uniref:Uncharacterized protein n=1 Tax=Nephila pilipes TaxID=299642 RepID=A0A8X6NFS2_NEPPI|nr:hypothetical protein NPIL_663951 [Nephila pilipes]
MVFVTGHRTLHQYGTRTLQTYESDITLWESHVYQQKSRLGTVIDSTEKSKKKNQSLLRNKVLKNLMYFLYHEAEGEEHRVLVVHEVKTSTKRKELHKPVQSDELLFLL